MSTFAEPITLDSVLTSAQLPALPQSAIALLQLSQQGDKGPADFAKPIEADAGLMGQVLRFVNSSYFGFSREIGSIQQAITLVGVRSITNFALWSAVFSVIPNPKFGRFDLKGLWQDSLRRALFARRLGKELKLPEAEDLFAGALLQDMALPLLLKQLPDDYERLIARREAEGMRLSLLEREAFGWDHAEAAAVLARNWKLPESFAELIQNHTHLERLLAAGTAAQGPVCVALASLLPSTVDQAWPERAMLLDGFERLSGESEASLLGLLEETDAAAVEFAPLLKLPTPKRSLAEHWRTAGDL
ncbi:HDOD domain-containing protein [Candidatus Laterigemmans baculatus]|uniref:HDOD domain-containing protein n=1 Tax=Candidatus Laterigemmans baculatus TaxID=2770505 RepID=UPI0013DB4147|nr:HDOD domain-containing protein [Candidatus Laterigemmans baculatus]